MDFGKCWSDGALKNDIPARQLAEQFNVNFLVVSQVNPHIVPFVYECRGSSGRPIMRTGGSSLRGGFFSSAAEAFLKLEMRKWLRMISELDLMPMLFSQVWCRLRPPMYDCCSAPRCRTGRSCSCRSIGGTSPFIHLEDGACSATS